MWRKSRQSSIDFAAFALLGFLASAAAPAARHSESAIDPAVRLARSVLKSEDCQTEMPGDRVEKPPLVLLLLGPYAIWGLYALIGLSVLLLAWWLHQEFGGRAAGNGGIRVPEAGAVGREGLSRTADLTDAERWARQGNYREAIHVLLLVAIQRLIEPLPARPDVSRTSRELLRLLPLGPGRREAFAALVGQVEVAVFGDRAVDSGQYAACRASFEALFAGRQT